MPSSKKASPGTHRSSRSHGGKSSGSKRPAHRARAKAHRSTAAAAVAGPLDPMSATPPAFALSTVAAIELEAFAKLLRNCKKTVGSFSDDQKHKLRLILGRAHRALEQI